MGFIRNFMSKLRELKVPIIVFAYIALVYGFAVMVATSGRPFMIELTDYESWLPVVVFIPLAALGAGVLLGVAGRLAYMTLRGSTEGKVWQRQTSLFTLLASLFKSLLLLYALYQLAAISLDLSIPLRLMADTPITGVAAGDAWQPGLLFTLPHLVPIAYQLSAMRRKRARQVVVPRVQRSSNGAAESHRPSSLLPSSGVVAIPETGQNALTALLEQRESRTTG